MATPQEREAFLRGWRAAMDEVLAVLAEETDTWRNEEQEASRSGEYKLPGSFALEEVSGSFKGRRDLLAWVTQNGPAAVRAGEPGLVAAMDALVEDRASAEQRDLLGLAPVLPEENGGGGAGGGGSVVE
ncbi:MAG TPA: hypothetical protein VJQ45_07385 [Ktedonobacterales bacterium]|nr:hypothetical protein [Ktedonobacterales bacterium]